MADTFVDVTYRGLELGKRLKLRDVRAEAAYLEVPLPMPVGTRVSIDAGDGVVIEAFVTSVHEQVGGSDHVPGMKVRPTLAGKAQTWWQSRIDAAATAAEAEADAKAAEASRQLAEAVAQARAEEEARAAALKLAAEQATAAAAAEAAEAAASSSAVPQAPIDEGPSRSKKNGKRNGKRARSESGQHDAVEATPPPAQGSGRATMVMSADAVKAALAAADVEVDDGLVDDGKRTEMMAAIDPATLEAAGAAEPVDDGIKRTTVMDAIDISMITGEPTTEIGAGAAAADDDDAEITIEAEDGDEAPPSASGSMPAVGNGKGRKSGKRRKKR